MGRFRCLPVLVASCVLLTGCSHKPGEIHTDLPYVSRVVGGSAIGGNNVGDKYYGQDGYYYDDKGNLVPIDPSIAFDPNGITSEDIRSINDEYSSYWASVSASRRNEQSTPEDFPVPDEITFDDAHTYPDNVLYAYYQNKNSRGFYKDDHSFYDKENDCWGTNLHMYYGDAVKAYTKEYGTPDIATEHFTYWFEGKYAYCVALDGPFTVWSVSTYKNIAAGTVGNVREFSNTNTNSPSIVDDAYVTYGATYHFDYYNYIYRTATGYLLINRETYGTTVI